MAGVIVEVLVESGKLSRPAAHPRRITCSAPSMFVSGETACSDRELLCGVQKRVLELALSQTGKLCAFSTSLPRVKTKRAHRRVGGGGRLGADYRAASN